MLDTSSPQVRAVLPLLYVAWADGVLTPSEAETLRARIRSLDWIDAAVREEVCGYLDPQSPPSAPQHHRWLRALREAAADAPVTTRCSLAELGVEMATATGDGAAVPDASVRALEDIESVLGVDGEEVLCDVLSDRPETEPGAAASDAPFDVEALTDRLEEMARAGETRTLRLGWRIPVQLVYFTAWVDTSGRVQFRPDLYDRDDSADTGTGM